MTNVVNLFETVETTKKQGGLGQARAMYEYTRLGYSVCLPINDDNKYDLIIERDGACKRVQVKTSTHVETGNSNPTSYSVILDCRTGVKGESRPRQKGDYDLLFVLVPDGRCWSIPERALGDVRFKITVGNTKYNEYILGL